VPARDIQLVVLDSVAALLRHDLGERSQLMQRQEQLGTIAVALKRMAELHRIPVLVTNQVGGPRAHESACCNNGQQMRACDSIWRPVHSVIGCRPCSWVAQLWPLLKQKHGYLLSTRL
jgi:hypothetical protein